MLDFVFGQRVVLGDYQIAVITGVHPANQPIIHSGNTRESDRQTYPVDTFSVTWSDAIDVVVTLIYDRTALIRNGNQPGVDRWHVDDSGHVSWR